MRNVVPGSLVTRNRTQFAVPRYISTQHEAGSSSLTKIAAEWDNNVASRSEELEQESDRTYKDVLVPQFLSFLSKYKHRSKVLDVGCGLGFLSHEVAKHGYTVEAIDISSKSINYARSHFPRINFQKAEIAAFAPAHKNEFDVCIANMVLHNTPHLERIIRAVYRALLPNGLLLISIPHPWFWALKRTIANEVEKNYSREWLFKVNFKISNGDPHPSPITYFHRPLGQYLGSLKQNGFLIEDIIELRNPDGLPQPDLLFFVCKKTSGLMEQI